MRPTPLESSPSTDHCGESLSFWNWVLGLICHDSNRRVEGNSIKCFQETIKKITRFFFDVLQVGHRTDPPPIWKIQHLKKKSLMWGVFKKKHCFLLKGGGKRIFVFCSPKPGHTLTKNSKKAHFGPKCPTLAHENARNNWSLPPIGPSIAIYSCRPVQRCRSHFLIRKTQGFRFFFWYKIWPKMVDLGWIQC